MAKRKPLAIIDAETDPFEYNLNPEPFVWGYYDGLDFDYFWGNDDICTEELIDFIYERDVLIYAHNGGKFDFFYLLPYLKRENISLINGRISQAHIGRATLRDSYNIIPVPLRAYKKDPFDYQKMKRENRDKHRAEILKYLENDCVYLYELVSAFEDRFGRKLTIASAAMGKLKGIIEEKTMRPFERFTESQDAKYRPYYYGGRCDAVEKGELDGPWKIYDINSAYSKAMLDKHPDPTYNSFYIDTKLPKHIQCYFAHIKAKSKGCLPWRLPPLDDLSESDKLLCGENGISLKRSEYEEGKLLFPNDNRIRDYYATGWEIQAGLDTKSLTITSIIEVRIPDKVLDFSDYVLPIYDEKKNAKSIGDAIAELFAKLLLNSPYGKFALNPRDFKEYILTEYGEFPTIKEVIDGVTKYIDDERFKLNGTFPDYGIDVYERPKYEDDEFVRGFYNVSVAASITGNVRAFLWRSMCQSERVIYTDTDSIMCRKFHGEESNELGDWKCEGEADIAYIGGRKMYAFRITKGKGLRFYKDSMGQDKYEEVTEGERWKIASKGARLRPDQIIDMVTNKAVIKWYNPAPTNSLRFGTRFLSRKVQMT